MAIGDSKLGDCRVRTLREWRVAQLMSTRVLADVAQVSNKTLIDIELGRRRPHYGTMSKLSAALGVKPEEIAEFAAAMEELTGKGTA